MSEESDVIEFDDEYTQEDEDRLKGEDAGKVFAQRHIIEKMNLFIKVYREKGWSMEFIEGFVEGINQVTGGTISLKRGDQQEESDEEEVDNEAESD